MIAFRYHWHDPLFRALCFISVSLLIALVSFHFMFYSWTVESASRLEIELKSLEREYAYQYEIANQINIINEASPALDITIEKLNRKFSTVAFSGDLDAFVASAGVSLLAQSYDDPRAVKGYSFVPVQVRLKGKYPSLRRFIQSLGQGRFYIVINKAKVEQKGNELVADLEFQVRYLEEKNAIKKI